MKMQPSTKHCASCGAARGNTRTNWSFALRNGTAYAVTCSSCPRHDEPIRRIEGARGVRFRAVVDASAPGAAKRQQKTSTHATLDAARAWVAEVREAVERDGVFAPADETVEQLCARWLANRRGIREVSAQGYEAALRRVLPRLGSMAVRELRPAHIDSWVTWAMREGSLNTITDEHGVTRGKPLGARSIRYTLIALGQALDLAMRDGIISSNPARVVEPPKYRRDVGAEVAHWPSELVTENGRSIVVCRDLDRFRAVSDRDPLGGVFRLSMCGLTRSDIHGLQWGDIDLDRGVLTVSRGRVALRAGEVVTGEPKSRRRVRTVEFEAIEPGTVELLRKIKASQARERLAAGEAWHDSGFVLVDALGHPTHPNLYSDRFERLVKAAGVPPLHLHGLRHTLAKRLDLSGVSPADGAALLGHDVAVYLATYLPRGGDAGASRAASALSRASGRLTA